MDEQTILIQRTEKLLQQGKTAEARALLAACLKTNPASAQLWFALSRVVDNDQQEIDCLERALRVDPFFILARNRLDELKNASSTSQQGFTFSDDESESGTDSLGFDNSGDQTLSRLKELGEPPELESEPFAFSESSGSDSQERPSFLDSDQDESLDQLGGLGAAPGLESESYTFADDSSTDNQGSSEIEQSGIQALDRLEEYTFSSGYGESSSPAEPSSEVEEEKPAFDLFQPGAFEQQQFDDSGWSWNSSMLDENEQDQVEVNPALNLPRSEAPAWAEQPAEPIQATNPALDMPRSEIPVWAETAAELDDSEDRTREERRRKRTMVVDIVVIGTVLLLLLSVVAYFLLQDLGLLPSWLR